MSSISNFLIYADQLAEYTPIFSTISSAVHLMIESIIAPENSTAVSSNHYYTYIRKKSIYRSIILLTPFWGNAYIFLYDDFKKSNSQDLVRNFYSSTTIFSTLVHDDKEIAMKAMKKIGDNLKHASENLKDDTDIVWQALENNNGKLLQHASERIQNNREFILNGVKRRRSVLYYAREIFKNDRDFVFEAAQSNDGEALQYADKRLLRDRDLILKIVKQQGKAIRYASSSIRNDKDVVLAAVMNDLAALKFISQLDPKEIVHEAWKKTTSDKTDFFRRLKAENSTLYSGLLETIQKNSCKHERLHPLHNIHISFL